MHSIIARWQKVNIHGEKKLLPILLPLCWLNLLHVEGVNIWEGQNHLQWYREMYFCFGTWYQEGASVLHILIAFFCDLDWKYIYVVTESELRLQQQQAATRSAASMTPTSSSLSIVTSILNDHHSRMGGIVPTTDRIRLPTPPLIEPRLDVLSRHVCS